MTTLDFKHVADIALRKIESVLARWVPGGKFEGSEYKALNPTRNDKNLGSFSINRNSGAWSEFAEGKGGSDLVSLVAYIDRINQGEACKQLMGFLGLDAIAGDPVSSSVAQVQTKTPKKIWQPIMPVPASALKSCPSKHYKNGAPSDVWSYFDAKNQLLMKIMRFDKNGSGGNVKDYRPLTYCELSSNNSERQWRWQQPPNKRPLYGLDKLAKGGSNSPVLLTEGEKAADAAIRLLPDLISMTWPGGSNALNKADFSPLRDRSVYLWPDNDDAGKSCMSKLATMLKKMNCSVIILNLDLLGANWQEKADAADVKPSTEMERKIKELYRDSRLFGVTGKKIEKKKPSNKTSEKIGRFIVNDSGVFYLSDFEGDDNTDTPPRICDRLDILALTRDKQGKNWGTLVRFTDPDNVVKEWNIPSELLATEGGAEVLRQLFSLGLRAESGQQPRRRLIQYIQSAKTIDRYVLVNRIGWHGVAYLLPERTVGLPKEPLYFYSNTPDLNKLAQAGNLDDWKNNIASLCDKNPLLMFVVSAALAAPLLHLIGMETTGFHFFGDSSQGKTTLLKVAASVYGSADYVRNWRSTDNALESIAAAHSDGLLILDEISQSDPRIVGDVAYLLGNGKGKARANDRGGIRGNSFEWRLLFLSSGEKTLEQHMAEAGKKTKAGQEARLLAIPCDAGDGAGIFNHLHGLEGGAKLSTKLTENSTQYYGTAFQTFIEKLCASDLNSLSEMIRDKLTVFQNEIPVGASGQVVRAANKFALVAFAGELAIKAGIADWKTGSAKEAALFCFKSWLATRGGIGNLEDQQILSQVKSFFSRYGESKFTRWDRDDTTIDEHAARTLDRCGFRRTDKDNNVLNDSASSAVAGTECSEYTYYVFSDAFTDEICKGVNPKRAKQMLAECGALERDVNGGYTIPHRLPGSGRKQQRVCVIKPHLIPDRNE